jgi:hypothetical protein
MYTLEEQEKIKAQIKHEVQHSVYYRIPDAEKVVLTMTIRELKMLNLMINR